MTEAGLSFRRRGRLPRLESLFTPAEAREIRDRYRAGETVYALVPAYRASHKTIRLILRGQAGYPLQAGEEPVVLRTAADEVHRISLRNREALKALHAEGKTAMEAAEASGLALSTIRDIGREFGLKWRRPSPPIRHGTLAGYRRCGPPRCEPCRAANRTKMRDYLARRRSAA